MQQMAHQRHFNGKQIVLVEFGTICNGDGVPNQGRRDALGHLLFPLLSLTAHAEAGLANQLVNRRGIRVNFLIIEKHSALFFGSCQQYLLAFTCDR